MQYSVAYEEFMNRHRKSRTSSLSRQNRLYPDLGYAEQRFLEYVWWPLFLHFADLHPEYEVQDYKGGYRYIDFAYIQPHFRIGIEIDGFGPHWRNISKWKFSEHCQRHNSLVIDGWHLLCFAYDDIEESPKLCQQAIQQMLGRWLHHSSDFGSLTSNQRDIIRYASRVRAPITPSEICQLLHIGSKNGRQLLHTLVAGRWLQPASGKDRITSYELHPSRSNIRW